MEAALEDILTKEELAKKIRAEIRAERAKKEQNARSTMIENEHDVELNERSLHERKCDKSEREELCWKENEELRGLHFSDEKFEDEVLKLKDAHSVHVKRLQVAHEEQCKDMLVALAKRKREQEELLVSERLDQCPSWTNCVFNFIFRQLLTPFKCM